MGKIKLKPEIREEVFERDKRRCVICGCNIEEELHCHHILNRNFRNLINCVRNLVTLCWRCHDKVHSNQRKWRPILQRYIKWVYGEEKEK